MPKVRASSATIGNHARPDGFVLEELRKQLHEHHRGRLVPLADGEHGTRTAAASALRAGRWPPRSRRLVSRYLISGLSGPGLKKRSCATSSSEIGRRESVAELAQRVVVELLLLVRAHPALSPGPHAVAFLGLGEHHGGPSAVVRRAW
jgi:hypothetical protein